MQGIFGRKSRLEILRALYDSGAELTGREVARRSGFSHQQAHNALRELAALGIVERKTAGTAYLFGLNRKHWFVTDVAAVIFSKDKSWLNELLEEFAVGLPRSVRSLILFGSAARNRLHPGSDIDLLALVGNERDKKVALDYFTGRSAGILARYHYPLAPVVLTEDEFRRQYRRKNAFAREILKTGRVVRGKLLTEIL